jgi:hypothetical protein
MNTKYITEQAVKYSTVAPDVAQMYNKQMDALVRNRYEAAHGKPTGQASFAPIDNGTSVEWHRG